MIDFLESYDLGSSEEPARHWLLLDRQERALYVSEAREAARFLARHAPPVPDIAGEQLDALLGDLLRQTLNLPPPDPAEVQRRMMEQNQLIAALEDWLDQETAAPS